MTGLAGLGDVALDAGATPGLDFASFLIALDAAVAEAGGSVSTSIGVSSGDSGGFVDGAGAGGAGAGAGAGAAAATTAVGGTDGDATGRGAEDGVAETVVDGSCTDCDGSGAGAGGGGAA